MMTRIRYGCGRIGTTLEPRILGSPNASVETTAWYSVAFPVPSQRMRETTTSYEIDNEEPFECLFYKHTHNSYSILPPTKIATVILIDGVAFGMVWCGA